MKIQHLIPILFLAAFCTVSAQINNTLTPTNAVEPIPPIQGSLPMDLGTNMEIGALIEIRTGNFLFGNPREGIRIGISSVTNQYQLNHRIDVWTCIETAKPYPPGHTLMCGDPLFDDNFLYISTQDGKLVAKVDGGCAADGPPGLAVWGGVSDILHKAIRKPGTYNVQWKTGGLESGVVTFTVLPE